ncbi:hypothetical protein NP233_g2470 [Leucocoprinus birnbaumii]|uniref:Uncharacterized protein n=1 Tax=Leucocoprinus birnbaumii TaxID=56174 RepID=A0AAD5YUW1_9AGAR|nr:hypothetical protein NP233_g2470 [Leucocoprinus birnbaumii]
MPGQTPWPAESQLHVIACAAQGLMLFARIVLDYIGDDEAGNPPAQLLKCLNFLRGGRVATGENPLDPLETLYFGILGTIPKHILPLTLNILSARIFIWGCFGGQSFSALFGLDRVTFHSAMRHLHSVIMVPGPPDFSADMIIRHASFSDFLKRNFQSGAFCVTRYDTYIAIAKQCIQWRKYIFCDQDLNTDAVSRISWVNGGHSLEVTAFVVRSQWSLFGHLADSNISRLYTELRNIPFSSSKPYSFSDSHGQITRVIKQLLSFQVETDSIPETEYFVRTMPFSTTDDDLYESYAALIEHWNTSPIDSRLFSLTGPWTYAFLPLQTSTTIHAYRYIREAIRSPDSQYFLMGTGENAVFVVAYRPQLEPVHSAMHLSELISRLEGQVQQSIDPSTRLSFNSGSLIGTLILLANEEISDVMGDIIDILSENSRDDATIMPILCRKIFDRIPSHDRPILQRILAFLLCLWYYHLRTRPLNAGPAYLYQSTEGTLMGVRETSSDFREVELPSVVSPQDLERFFELDSETVEQALALMGPFIFRNRHTPFLNADFEEWLSLNLINIKLERPWNDTRFISLTKSRFCLADDEIWFDIVKSYIRSYNKIISFNCTEKDKMSPDQYPSSEISPGRVYKDMVTSTAWHALSMIANLHPEKVAVELKDLYFCHLHRQDGQFSEITVWYYFLCLARRLWEWDQEVPFPLGLVRVDPRCSTDQRLFEKLESTGHRYKLASFPLPISGYPKVYPISMHHDQESLIPAIADSYHVFLFGHQDKSCLIVMTDPETGEGPDCYR